jgi:hypothetical protein
MKAFSKNFPMHDVFWNFQGHSKKQFFSLLSPVSLTMLLNIHSRISLRIFEKTRNGPNGGPGGGLIHEKT